MFYTNFSQQGSDYLVAGYEDGEKFLRRERYSPYLFVETNKPTPFKTIYGKPVAKVDFDSIWEARDYIKSFKGVSGRTIYGSDNFLYNFIHEHFPGKIDYDFSLIRLAFLDIEVALPESGGFPVATRASEEITAITVYDSKTQVFHSFGMKDFDTTDPLLEGINVVYHKFETEKEMLRQFLRFWKQASFDIVTGWNSNSFDLVYLYFRLKQLWGVGTASELSPWGEVSTKEYKGKFGRDTTELQITGISALDYLDLYKKFSYTPQESYTLEHISQEELGEGKLDHSEYKNLTKFYEENFQKYLCYNIIDVRRVTQLEKKMRLLEMVVSFAMDAKINFADTMATVQPWDCIITNYLIDKNIVVPPKSYSVERSIMGGYVKEVIPGKYKWVVSFDANSLYPHIIMLMNISPETFYDKISDVDPLDVLHGKVNSWLKDSKEKNVTFTGIGTRFTREVQGFLSVLMEENYEERQFAKKQMLKHMDELEHCQPEEKKAIEALISKYKNVQQNIKIKMNSLFGALANAGFRYHSSDFAESITGTGQLIIQYAAKVINEYLNNLLGTNLDFVIASDTDSIYLNLEAVVEKFGDSSWDYHKTADYLLKVCHKAIGPAIEQGMQQFMQELNAHKPEKIVFKLENINASMLLHAKKKNCQYVVESEGVRYENPKVKVTGLEAIRSSTPKVCKSYIKEAFKIAMTQTEADLHKFVKEKEKEFQDLTFEEIAFPRGVNGVTEYYDPVTIFKLKTPIHVRASLTYNKVLEDTGLDKDYRKIADGDKIKFAYMKEPNPVNSNVFASLDGLPPELGVEEFIDYDLQFEKAFKTPVENVVKAMGWSTEHKASLESFFG